MLGLLAFGLILIANAVPFGLAALLAKPLTRDQRKRHIFLTIGIAALIAFGPRVPGMLSDILYRVSGQTARTITETVNLREGDRVGLDFDVTSVSTPDNTAYGNEPQIFFKSRYFRTIQVGVGVEHIGLKFETPRRNLLNTELIFDERTPDKHDVVIKVHGWEESSHYFVDVAISKGGRLLAEYRDRYRLRWPGMPTAKGDMRYWFAYLTQASLLEVVAESLYAGPQSRRYKASSGPVQEFLNEALHVTAATDPVPEAAQAVTMEIDPNFEWRAPVSGKPFDAQRPEGCTPPDNDDYQILSYSRDGISRYRDPDLRVDGQSFTGPLAAVCVDDGIATLLRHDGSVHRHTIAVYDTNLNLQCSMQFESTRPELKGKYSGGSVFLRATAVGFEVFRFWRSEDRTVTDVASTTQVIASPACAQVMGLGPERTLRELAETEREITESLANLEIVMPVYWQAVLRQRHQTWSNATKQRCGSGPAGLRNEVDELLLIQGESACLLNHYQQWQATLNKYAEIVQQGHPHRARGLSASEREWLGPLVPTVFVDTAPADSTSRPQRLELEIAWTETPVILSLDYSGPMYWHLYRSPAAWVTQVFLQCRRSCGETYGVNPRRYVSATDLDLPKRLETPPSDNFHSVLPTREFSVSEASVIRIGDTTIPILRTAPQAPQVRSQPITRPDHYDRMVEEALRRSTRKAIQTGR